VSSLGELLRRLGAWGRVPDVSAHGGHGDAMFGWITLCIAAVFTIVLVHLLLVIVRGRRALPSTGDGSDGRSRLIVIASTLALTLLVDVVAFVRSSAHLSTLLRRPQASERPIEVEVLAQQWAWSFRLAGADGRFGTDDDIVTLHGLRLPAGRPAILELRSKDVVHSLYVPALRLKRDAQPGSTTELLLEPTQPGRYEIACAQHCGANHYLMRATLEVVDDASFERYVASESAIARDRASARPSDGAWAWRFDGKAAP
jgi:cytochrome c oxidase subunit 2